MPVGTARSQPGMRKQEKKTNQNQTLKCSAAIRWGVENPISAHPVGARDSPPLPAPHFHPGSSGSWDLRRGLHMMGLGGRVLIPY